MRDANAENPATPTATQAEHGPQHPNCPPHTLRRPRVGLAAVLLTAALVASACQWPPGVADDPVLMAMLGGGSMQSRQPGEAPTESDGGILVDRVYIEARARLAASGAVEVSARVNATALNWRPDRHLFDYPNATIGDRWTSTPIGPAEVGISTVRIQARRLADGNLELALVTAAGQKVLPREPRLAYAALGADDWTYATPVVFTAAGEPAPIAPGSGVDRDRFVAISTGFGSFCGLRGDLTIHCWGNNFAGRASPPHGTFVALESGSPCAIRTDGTKACWGDTITLLTGPFIAISKSCGIRPDGRLDCSASDEAPDGHFTTITSGDTYKCGVRLDGAVDCWGQAMVRRRGPHGMLHPNPPSSPDDPPGGTFSAVSAGRQHTCGIRSDGAVECWGDDQIGQSSAPVGEFVALSAGHEHTCGIRADGRAECWGGGINVLAQQGRTDRDLTDMPSGAFTQIASHGDRTCGLRASGDVDCWYPIHHPPRAATLFDFSKEDGYGRWWSVYDSSYIPAGAFLDLAPGGRHVCGLRANHRVACWGNDGRGQATATVGPFSVLSAGGRHTCAIRADGTVECWGDDSVGQTSAPDGVFSEVSAGWKHTCGLRVDRSVACWGENAHGQATPPASRFNTIAAGERHTCGIRENDTVACWGDGSAGQANAPEGNFVALTAGALHTCGLRAGGTAVCWGDARFGQSGAPDGAFERLAAGTDYTCGLRPTGTVECWGGQQERWGVGGHSWSVENPPPASPPMGHFVALSAGSEIACAVRADGTGECWIATGLRTINTQPDLTATLAPQGIFRALSAGAYHTCAIDSDERLTCWGENTGAQATPPPGSYRSVNAGERHTCAMDTDQRLACWGDNTFGQSSAPVGRHLEVGAGNRHTCAIDTDQRLACWGDNTYEQSAPPSGRYQAVAAGERHTCALRTAGTVACWGDNTHHQAQAPDGLYTAITAGRFGTCALRTAGTVACWGLTIRDETDSPRTAPAGTFTAINAGTRHTCGIRLDRTIACWPQHGNSSGDRYEIVALGSTRTDWSPWRDSRADPLPGPFVAVSAGTYHTCGIRPDQTIDCWSANEPRQ